MRMSPWRWSRRDCRTGWPAPPLFPGARLRPKGLMDATWLPRLSGGALPGAS
ncbi:hypothetical protein HMPREF9057_00898 [Actinomyces sp. oral taxon 171 str. F0337]|nr:hypothetical protein HMPREF9057_00898 [Actinomyces sp. oral taxon 171 str. F0337]